MRRRSLLLALILTLAASVLSVLTTLIDSPPPRLLLRYGLPPAGGPTGRTTELEGLRFVELAPGYFRMGSRRDREQGDLLGKICAPLGLPWGKQPTNPGSEWPTRWVEVRAPFWIATTEVPNAVYSRFIPGHERPESSNGDEIPAGRVSWWKARRFCRRLGAKTGEEFRLPSEAEWEYAARAGSLDAYCFGDDEEDLPRYAWYTGNSTEKPHAVGARDPNAWGLFDMHGNVWEWCEDRAHPDYRGAPPDERPWSNEEPVEGPEYRVFRGGGALSGPEDCHASQRRWTVPGRIIAYLGFRPVMTAR